MKNDELRSAEYINKIRVLTDIIRYTVSYANDHDLTDLMEHINNELSKIA